MRVSEIMTPGLISVGEDATLIEALGAMVERKVGALVVLDAKGVVSGVLSEGDLLRRAELGTEKHRPAWLEFILGGGRTADEYRHTHGRRVGEIMTRGAITVEAEAELAEAVDSMTAHKIKRLVVVSGGNGVGVLARSDVLKALLASLPRRDVSRTDAEILADILAAFEREPWAPKGGVKPAVEAGIVTLEGAVTDDRLRSALDVLCENILGVKGVNNKLSWIEANSGYVVAADDEKA